MKIKKDISVPQNIKEIIPSEIYEQVSLEAIQSNKEGLEAYIEGAKQSLKQAKEETYRYLDSINETAEGVLVNLKDSPESIKSMKLSEFIEKTYAVQTLDEEKSLVTFHVMNQLPEDLSPYKNSFIVIETTGAPEVYCILTDGNKQSVDIADPVSFTSKWAEIKSSHSQPGNDYFQVSADEARSLTGFSMLTSLENRNQIYINLGTKLAEFYANTSDLDAIQTLRKQTMQTVDVINRALSALNKVTFNLTKGAEIQDQTELEDNTFFQKAAGLIPSIPATIKNVLDVANDLQPCQETISQMKDPLIKFKEFLSKIYTSIRETHKEVCNAFKEKFQQIKESKDDIQPIKESDNEYSSDSTYKK